MMYTWDWSVLWQHEPVSGEFYLGFMATGLLWTVAIAGLSYLIALCLGTTIASIHTNLPGIPRRICRLYVGFFRNTPPLVQMFIWFFVIPELLPTTVGIWVKSLPMEWMSFFTAVICISLFISARLSEHIRSGIIAVPANQWEASLALGLDKWTALRHIILPQAFRSAVPVLGSEMINTVKNTSLTMTIGVMEIMSRSKVMYETTYRVFEALMIATVLYVVINLCVLMLTGWIERKTRVTGYVGDR